MRAVLTRVKSASVTIDGNVVGKIGQGFLILLGVTHEDTEAQAVKLADKLVGLRIFEDENGKTNLSIGQVDGEILVVSQFTLYADCKKGNRPSFVNAGSPVLANEIYEHILKRCNELFKNTQSGVFGADMKVTLTNDGPFTILLDSKEIL